MKLSILIPMYNAQENIGNCLDSLLNQDIPLEAYEIIIMDDGSKDNSVAIVNKYIQDYKNIKLYQQPNAGCYSTRNKLLKLAKGDYIYNLDADDYVVHNCFAGLLNISLKDHCDIIGFRTLETKALNEVSLDTKISDNDFEINSGKTFIENNLKLRYEIWWYFIKRDFLEEHYMSFNTNEYNADVVFTLEALLKAKKIAYLPMRIHRYVQTQDSLMRSKNFAIIKKRLSYIQMMIINFSKIINGLKAESPSINAKIIHNTTHRRDIFTFFHILNMIKNPFSLTYVKESIKALKVVNAYPITNFISKEYNSYKYRLLLFLLNSPILIYLMVFIKNAFSKPKEKTDN